MPAAALAHDEAVDGDLSNDAAAPTPLVFGPGANVVAGRVTTAAAPADVRDYITFTIPAGRQLTGLRLVDWVNGNTGFHAINVGATSFVPSGATDNNFLGGDHVNPAFVAFDLVRAAGRGHRGRRRDGAARPRHLQLRHPGDRPAAVGLSHRVRRLGGAGPPPCPPAITSP